MTDQALSKEQAVALYGGNQAALARAVGVTRQYISKLPEGPLPEWMDLKLRFVIKPEAPADKLAGLSGKREAA